MPSLKGEDSEDQNLGQEESSAEESKRGSSGSGELSGSIGSASEEDDDPDDESTDEEPVEYDSVRLKPLEYSRLSSALRDEDTELWLVRVPRHESLKTSLEGSEILLNSANEEKDASADVDRIAGPFKGSYVYRDHGKIDRNAPRPTFVTQDSSGQARLEVGKPFAKSVTVTFNVNLTNLNKSDPLPRRYPQPPKNQKLKYYPIGSAREGLVAEVRNRKALPAERIAKAPPGQSADDKSHAQTSSMPAPGDELPAVPASGAPEMASVGDIPAKTSEEPAGTQLPSKLSPRKRRKSHKKKEEGVLLQSANSGLQNGSSPSVGSREGKKRSKAKQERVLSSGRKKKKRRMKVEAETA